MSDSLRNLYTKKIDDMIARLKNKQISKIYGGYTEKSLTERKQEHINKDPNFAGMTIKKIIKTDSGNQIEQIKLAENYLINRLNTEYGKNIVLNAYNKDGTIKQTGGFGMQYNEGDVLKIYVMYK